MDPELNQEPWHRHNIWLRLTQLCILSRFDALVTATYRLYANHPTFPLHTPYILLEYVGGMYVCRPALHTPACTLQPKTPAFNFLSCHLLARSFKPPAKDTLQNRNCWLELLELKTTLSFECWETSISLSTCI